MKATLFAVAVTALLSSVSHGEILVQETFDYADHAALAAVWNASGDNPEYQLDSGTGNPAASYSMPSPTANFQGRLALNIPGGSIQPTDANPLQFSYDLLLDSSGDGPLTSWNNARHYVELRGYENGAFGDGDLKKLLAVGVFNNSSEEDGFSTERYQGRVLFGEEPVGCTVACDWHTLDEEPGAPSRGSGWHRLGILITSSEIQFSVDGVLAEIEPRPNSFGFDSIVLGSDLTANGYDARIDNVSLVRLPLIPEPSTAVLAIVAFGLLGSSRGKAIR